MDNKSIAYMNIAMIKYWCKDKYNPYLIPLVPSISLLSTTLYTETSIEKSDKDEFILNDVLQDEKETKKVFQFVNKVIENRECIRIISKNNMPTAAGLASSASAYAALTKELNRYFKLDMNVELMCKIASMGSGSAARSFFEISAFTEKGEIYEIKTNLELSMLAIIVSDSKKDISSRDAMEITKKTSSILDEWVIKNKEYFENAKRALKENDFKTLGENMEKSTELMHETMKKSNPSFSYLKKESIEIIKRIKEMRNEGFEVYYTTDAGPNVKVLYKKEQEAKIMKVLEKEYKGAILKC